MDYKTSTTAFQREAVNSIPLEISAQEDYLNADYISEQPVFSETPKQIDFNLKNDCEEIKKTLRNAEEDRAIEENMKTWRIQLDSIETDEEKIRIAMEFDIDILIKALEKNVEEVDDTYSMFCKKEDRKQMHFDSINKIKEDMKNEYDEILPYITRAEKYKSKMM